jgi:hypothetical protein
MDHHEGTDGPDLSDEPPSLDELLGRSPVTAPASDTRHQRWCGWLKDIDTDLTDVALARSVWRTINTIVAEHPGMPPSLLFDAQARNYAAAQAVAVRRQVDHDSHSVTMIRLLEEIRDNTEVLSRQRYVAMFPWGMQHLGDSQFNDWAETSGSCVEAAFVTKDIDTLVGVTDTIRKYVNRHIAHLDERRSRITIPSFNDLDVAIDLLFELFRKYNVVLTGSDRAVRNRFRNTTG